MIFTSEFSRNGFPLCTSSGSYSNFGANSFLANIFQNTLIVEIRPLVTWLKSTLLLKIECRDTHIYMKTECLQTKWDAAFLGGKKGTELL